VIVAGDAKLRAEPLQPVEPRSIFLGLAF
jgi:hypothetical protein